MTQFSGSPCPFDAQGSGGRAVQRGLNGAVAGGLGRDGDGDGGEQDSGTGCVAAPTEIKIAAPEHLFFFA